MPSTDSEILSALKAGHDLEAVYKELYTTYYRMCLNIVVSIIENQEEAHDVVQNVFIELFTKEYYKDSNSITALLLMMCKQRAQNYLRDKKTEHHYLKEYAELERSRNIPHFATEFHAKFDNAVEQLPEKLRTIYMAHLEKNRYDQIAVAFQMNINTVKFSLKKAVKFIKHHLANDES
ncbi:RNA polymerase sigma factor [Chitinophaga sp. Hz27]|uniref:RNA polymerase sigma factor n=1 Tax=Chitinophaga sp. Hz27 TaxID=3347169 RepID=UPI0035E2DE60